MSEERITGFDTALAVLRLQMVMLYGGTLISAKTDEEKADAYASLITAGIAIITAAVTSRQKPDDAMQVLIEQFPELLTKFVDHKLEMMAKIEAQIERQGATVQ